MLILGNYVYDINAVKIIEQLVHIYSGSVQASVHIYTDKLRIYLVIQTSNAAPLPYMLQLFFIYN